ncbi:TIM barrel protein [bacterium]|nr:TIM barrel protein [bacterium]
MKLGYNTNGLAHHRFTDAVAMLADHGFEAMAITPDVGWLDPYQNAATLLRQVDETARTLDHFGMTCVMESGARYLINPRKKHDPTLMDADPERRSLRIDYLERLIRLAGDLHATCFSFWSGKIIERIPQNEADQRLADGIHAILPLAESLKIPLAFEPEPGMYIETLDDFRRIDRLIFSGWFGLTIDLGHLHCLGETPIDAKIREWSTRILNIHIEDMVPGVHEHLPFGQGTMDFPPIFRALDEISYPFSVCVELSRDSHRADLAVSESAAFLRQAIDAARTQKR